MTTPPVSIAHVRVRDAMHPGILTTDPSTPLRDVARQMAEHRVHAIAVSDSDSAPGPWGIITALDVAAAAASGGDTTAGEAAATEVVTVSADAPLDVAAQTLSEHGLGHVIVVDAASGHPVGVLSALDIVVVYAA
jgi:CBS domain-containing protein